MKLAPIFCVWILIFKTSACLSQAQPDTTRERYLKAAKEIMAATTTAALITVDENGKPQVRSMDPFAPEEDFTVWLATNPTSRKVNQIRKNANVVLYYHDKDNQGYVTLHGRASLINDASEKKKYWKDEWQAFYPDRDKGYLLIKISPVYLELINYRFGIHGDPATWKPVRVNFK